MLVVIKDVLKKIIDDIDTGNSNITTADEIKIIDVLKEYTHKDEGISKAQAATYLNVSRATFDNYVKDGLIPHGKKILGFKEKRWYKKDLDAFIVNTL